MRNMLAVAYLEMDAFIVVLLALILIQVNKSHGRTRIGLFLYNLTIAAAALAILADMLARAADGQSFAGARAVVETGAALVLLLTPAIFLFWLFFTDYKLCLDALRLRRRAPLYLAPFLANAVFLLCNIWTRGYYYVDEHNAYHRGPLMYLMFACSIAYAAWAAILSLRQMRRGRSAENRRLCLRHIIFFLPVLAGIALQFVFADTSFAWLGLTLAIFLYYIQDQIDRAERARRQEQELAQNRISMMLSQIQPHFLYNSLVVIKQLCDTDPRMAKEAVVEFSDYLRGNLDSLNMQRPIPFEKELEHVENYLALEKKRFGERIRVRYEIGPRNFRLPSLTVQPLVENAVRYGITKKDAGGTVTIRTTETGDGYLVAVEDDGMGFDPYQTKPDGRTHIGIDNVKNRLAAMIGGRLDIQSIPGRGTAATIYIPKGGDAT